jgi:hypothetical protein
MELYLDATPLIRALRENPDEFDMRNGQIVHRASCHALVFDLDGSARLFAGCSCAELPISQAQSEEILVAATVWETTYWRPLAALEAAKRHVAEINRAFAAHFRPRTPWRKAMDAIRRLVGLLPPDTNFRLSPSISDDPARVERVADAEQQLEWLELTLL